MKNVPHAQTFAIVLAVIATVSPVAARTHAVDAQRSKMTVHVYKQGLFSFLADNHTVDAPIDGGSYDSEAGMVELKIDATKLRVLDPTLPADKREKVQSNMIGPQVLDAARYPTIGFRSTKIEERSASRWAVTGDLTLHGQTHPLTIQIARADATHFSGSAIVRQTTFGITPIRVAGGTVSVRDDVTVDFTIVLIP